jgi:hypothetical protein
MHCDIIPPHMGSGCYQHSQDGLPYVLEGWVATQLVLLPQAVATNIYAYEAHMSFRI